MVLMKYETLTKGGIFVTIYRNNTMRLSTELQKIHNKNNYERIDLYYDIKEPDVFGIEFTDKGVYKINHEKDRKNKVVISITGFLTLTNSPKGKYKYDKKQGKILVMKRVI